MIYFGSQIFKSLLISTLYSITDICGAYLGDMNVLEHDVCLLVSAVHTIQSTCNTTINNYSTC
jgi:hypothetical protein